MRWLRESGPRETGGGGLAGWQADKNTAEVELTIGALEALAERRTEASMVSWGGVKPSTVDNPQFS
jgi:hypothetical protein